MLSSATPVCTVWPFVATFPRRKLGFKSSSLSNNQKAHAQQVSISPVETGRLCGRELASEQDLLRCGSSNRVRENTRQHLRQHGFFGPSLTKCCPKPNNRTRSLPDWQGMSRPLEMAASLLLRSEVFRPNFWPREYATKS